MSFKKEHRQETLIYLGLWAMLFIAPAISLSVRIANTDDTFNWSEVLMVWKEFLPFFIVFLIHNHLLATQLIYRQRKWLYMAACVALMVIFHIWQTNHRPNFRENHRQRMEMRAIGDRPPMPRDEGRPFDDGQLENRPPEGRPFEPEAMPLDAPHDSIAQYNPRDYRHMPRLRDRR